MNQSKAYRFIKTVALNNGKSWIVASNESDKAMFKTMLKNLNCSTASVIVKDKLNPKIHKGTVFHYNEFEE